MEAISNSEFSDFITIDPARVVGKSVHGNVLLQGLELRSVDWSGCHFSGHVAIRNCKVGASLILDNCVFDAGLDIESSEVGGWVSAASLSVQRDLKVRGLTIHSCSPPRVERGGNSIDRQDLFTALSLRGSTIGGDVQWQEIKVGAEVKWLSAQGIEVGGDFHGIEISRSNGTSGDNAEDLHVSLQFDGCRVAGAMHLERCALGQVKLRAAIIPALTVRDCWIDKTLNLSDCRIGRIVFADGVLENEHFETIGAYLQENDDKLDPEATLSVMKILGQGMLDSIEEMHDLERNQIDRSQFSEGVSSEAKFPRRVRRLLAGALSSGQLREFAGYIYLLKALITIAHPNMTPRGMSLVFHVDLHGAEIDVIDLRGAVFYCDRPRTAPITGEKCLIRRELIAAASSFMGADRTVPVMDLSYSVINRISLSEEIPRPMALVGTIIEHWGYLGPDSEPAEFIRAIDNISGDDITLFRNVEAGYAANGNHEAANAIYRHWRRKVRLRSSLSSQGRGRLVHLLNWPGRAFSFVHDYLFGFGTRLGFSISVLVALFLISWFSIASQWSSLVALPPSFLAEVSEATGTAVAQSGVSYECDYPKSKVAPAQELETVTSNRERWAANTLCVASMQEAPTAERIAYAAVIALQSHAPMLALEAMPSVGAGGRILGVVPTRIWFDFMTILNWLGIPLIIAVGIGRLIPRRYS